jgi:hypothetical protein
MGYKRISVTLRDEAQHKRLKKLATRWAAQVEEETGLHIPQPVSKYLQHLIEHEAREQRVR